MILLGGHVVEKGTARDVLSGPLHPYTQLLRASVLEPGAPVDEGAPAAVFSAGLVSGCRFSGRCPHAFERCRVEVPGLYAQPDGRGVRCFLQDQGLGTEDGVR